MRQYAIYRAKNQFCKDFFLKKIKIKILDRESEENRNGVELSWFVNAKDKTKATESIGSAPSERRATPISQANTYFVNSAALSDVAKHVWMYACIGAIGGLFDLRFKGVNMICGVSVAHKENNTFLISIWLKNREPLFSIADWMNELIKKQEHIHGNSSETKRRISISGGIVRDNRKLIGKFIKSQTLSMHNN